MIESMKIDSNLLAQSAYDLGQLMQSANTRENQFIESMLGIANDLQSSAPSEEGLGEAINTYV